jgi:hypothetical protein
MWPLGIYKAPCQALALGLPRMALSGGYVVANYPMLIGFCHFLTFSDLLGRKRGVVAPLFQTDWHSHYFWDFFNVLAQGCGADLPA